MLHSLKVTAVNLLIPSLLVGFVGQITLTGCSSSESSPKNDVPEALIMRNASEKFVIVSVETGKEISNTPFESSGSFSEVIDGVFWEEKNGEYWLHSAKEPSTPIVGLPFKSVTSFGSGRAMVGDGVSPIKIIDTKGEIVVTLPENISEAYPFSNDGLAVFRDSQTGLCGYIDTEGNIKIEPKYSFAFPFNEGYAIVSNGDGSEVEEFIIDKTGNQVYANSIGYFCKNTVSSGVIPIASHGDEYDDEYESPITEITYIKPNGDKVLTVKMNLGVEDGSVTSGAVDNCVVFCDESGQYGVKRLDGTIVLNCNYTAVEIISSKAFLVHRNYEEAIVGPDDKIIDGYCEYPSGFLTISNGRYLKYCPNPRSSKEQMYAGPGGDPTFVKANGYWICNSKGEQLSSDYEWWVNRDHIDISNPVRYVNAATIFNPVVNEISIDKVFGFGESTSTVDVAQRFNWEENENTQSNFRGYAKDHYYELPNGNYQQINMIFSDNIVHPKTHKETRGSGWMSYEEEVVDGYAFNPDAKLQYIDVKFTDFEGVSVKDAAKILCKTLEERGFKITIPRSSASPTTVLRLENESHYIEAKVADMDEYINLELSIPQKK